MKRIWGVLAAGAMVATTVLAGAGMASAATARPAAAFNTARTARDFTTAAMVRYTHRSAAALASMRAGGESYRAIAASAGVNATMVANAAVAQGQAAVNGLVRRRALAPAAARRVMAAFRADVRAYMTFVPGAPMGSMPATGTPGAIATMTPGPVGPSYPTTPGASAPTTSMPGMGGSTAPSAPMGPGTGTTTTPMPSAPTTYAPAPAGPSGPTTPAPSYPATTMPMPGPGTPGSGPGMGM